MLGAGDWAFKRDGSAAKRSIAKSKKSRPNCGVERISATAAIFVAVVAGGGAVDEIANAVVLVGGGNLLVCSRGVAVDAGEAGVVRGDLVAIVADRTVMGNGVIRVIESGAKPRGGDVASVASGRIPGGDVIGYGTAEGLRAVPLCLVAAIARSVGGSQRIVVVDVAIGAGLHAAGGGNDVAAGERPSGGAVIELAISPSKRVMASGTE